MKIAQHKWLNSNWEGTEETKINAQLCLLFGSRPTMDTDITDSIKSLKKIYPNAEIISCSTAGNILNDFLIDDTIISTSIEFNKTSIKAKSFPLKEESDHDLGKKIANYFYADDLAYVLILSTMGVNAGSVLNGINSIYHGKIPVSGGVAGDDTRFEKTFVGIGEDISTSQITAIGFYGKNLTISHGSKGGWDTFGPIRKVTKCKGNILYEVDNKPVLNLYKEYLGEKAKDLPASGLLFPFAIIESETKEPIVRGIQNIDEKTNSLILFGDVEEGQSIQLMRANFDNLISGAGDSAKETFLKQSTEPQLALLVSCVARRIVLGQLTEEELSETKKVLGPNTKMFGFYSYSELSPVIGDNSCHVHNQTMTITTFTEN